MGTWSNIVLRASNNLDIWVRLIGIQTRTAQQSDLNGETAWPKGVRNLDERRG